MYKQWPLGQVPIELQRTELQTLKSAGYTWNDSYEIVKIFENKVAKFAGSKYAIAVDSCSNGLFLCLKYLNATGKITIPNQTYVSVPMQILHVGCQIEFKEINWQGKYQLDPYPIWDAAVQWREGMYESGFHVISFQYKKRIPIGRGGMILTDDADAAYWLQRACHDGRDMNVLYSNDEFTAGWHYYMTPEDAARGILLVDAINNSFDDTIGYQNYIDLSNQLLFKKSL